MAEVSAPDGLPLEDRLNRPAVASWARWTAALLFLLLAARLGGWSVKFVDRVLQLDFACYYAAGKAINHGVSPYVNPVESAPELWDGVAHHVHSRFLYPPLTADLFRPLAKLKYLHAKAVWTGLNLLAVPVVLWLTMLSAGVRDRRAFVVALLAALAFHPLLLLLERGQIDLIVLLFVLVSLALIRRGGFSEFFGGMTLALAVLLKLHTGLLVLFLICLRRRVAIGGLLAGAATLVAVSAAVDGPAAIKDYVSVQLPRISRYGEGGPPEMRLTTAATLQPVDGDPERTIVLDGRSYKASQFRFEGNATAVRPISAMLRGRFQPPPSPSMLSAALVVILCGGAIVLLWKVGPRLAADAETATWQLALAALLLAAPLTWTMNVVWLLPLPLVIWTELRRPLRRTCGLAVATLGFVIAAAPDRLTFPLNFPMFWPGRQQFLIAEALVLVGLIVHLRSNHAVSNPSASEGLG